MQGILMSKIGKINISIPEKVKVALSGNLINIEGPLGKKSLNIDIDMFDFTHSYAAKVASLFAMFLLATALFDLLPELHRHILRISRPVTKTFMRTNTKSS